MRNKYRVVLLCFISSSALAMDRNDRPGSLVIEMNQYKSAIEAKADCPSFVRRTVKHPELRVQLKEYSTSQLGGIFFCNVVVTKYDTNYRGYVRTLEPGDDFDKSQATKLSYMLNYFSVAVEKEVRRFSPFLLTPLRSGFNGHYGWIEYRVDFPAGEVPDTITETLTTSVYDYGWALTEEEAKTRLTQDKAILTQAYEGFDLRFLREKIQESTVNGQVVYTEYVTYKVVFR